MRSWVRFEINDTRSPGTEERNSGAPGFSRSAGINPNIGNISNALPLSDQSLLTANVFQDRSGVKQKRDLCKGTTTAASLGQLGSRKCVNIVAQVQESLPASLSPLAKKLPVGSGPTNPRSINVRVEPFPAWSFKDLM